MMFVIITGLTLIFIFTTSWYISQTIVLGIATGLASQLTATGETSSLLSLIEFVNIIWGPLFDILVIIWMIASAQARDMESEIYG